MVQWCVILCVSEYSVDPLLDADWLVPVNIDVVHCCRALTFPIKYNLNLCSVHVVEEGMLLYIFSEI